jgi:hypothetical protein
MSNIAVKEILKTIEQLTAMLALLTGQLKRLMDNEKKAGK